MTLHKLFTAGFAVFLTATIIQPLYAATSIVQEETNRFHSDTIKYPAANTFLIESMLKKRQQACSGETGISTSKPGETTLDKKCQHLPVAHFRIGSAMLKTSEMQSLLEELQRCGILQTTPLHVTGYTCSTGTDQENLILSEHRAWKVANLLRMRGYTVKGEDVQGRGEENPLTKDRQIFAINRRVEITD